MTPEEVELKRFLEQPVPDCLVQKLKPPGYAAPKVFDVERWVTHLESDARAESRKESRRSILDTIKQIAIDKFLDGETAAAEAIRELHLTMEASWQ